MSDDIVERITAYLSGGGLFNPELANHDAVRDLLIDARAELAAVTAERDRMREALKPFADEFRLYKTDFPDHFYISDLGFTFGQLRAAAAALEGVTEPPR